MAALLAQPSIQKAASICGISKRTALRWMQDAGFSERFGKVQLQPLSHATAKLPAASGKAVDVLLAVSNDSRASSPSRVTASRAILELALRAHEDEELEARIRRLEMQTDDDAF